MTRSASRPFAEHAFDEGGRKKFAVLETKRGIKLPDVEGFLETLREEPGKRYRERQEAIEYMKTPAETGSWRPWSAKNRLMMGATEEVQTKFFSEVLILEENLQVSLTLPGWF